MGVGSGFTSMTRAPRLAAQLAKFGSQKARARFTWTGIAQQILRLTDELPHGLSLARLLLSTLVLLALIALRRARKEV